MTDRATVPDTRADGPLLLTVPQAMRLLNLSRSTVFRLIRQGTLERVKIGASLRLPRDAVHRLAQTGTRPRPGVPERSGPRSG